jgi:NADPH:quinone reductase-like Zn-dependent oxidoreductase
MKAFIIDRYKDEGRIAEVPEPAPGDKDVLMRVHTAGVNALDSKIRSGEFKQILPYRFPLILGNDVAGVVDRIGSGVRGFNPGDEVYSRPSAKRIGTFAELIAVDADDIALKPKKLTMVEAASIPLVGLTAWQALVEKANLQRGQKVLIHAGSGGVGSIAIQLAKHLGATVATTTSAENIKWVRALGADIVIDYKKEDFEAILRDYDVVLDSLGGKTLEKSLRILKPGGKLIGIAGPPDPAFAREIGGNIILKLVMGLLSRRIRKQARDRGVSYSFLFMKASGDQLKQLTALIDSDAIRPIIDRVFPFEETKEALAYVERGRSKGKVVIQLI